MLLAPWPWNKPKPALRTGREELHEYEAPQAPRLSTQVGTKRVQNEQEPLRQAWLWGTFCLPAGVMLSSAVRWESEGITPAKRVWLKAHSPAAPQLTEQTHSTGPCEGRGEREENTQLAPGPRLSNVFSH